MEQAGNRSDRDGQIARLVGDARAARAAGKSVNDDAIVRAHPHLAPELERELAKVRRVMAAMEFVGSEDKEEPESSEPRPRRDPLLEAMFESPSTSVPGYMILGELGRGGQAIVYLARQLSTGREVAVKVLRDGPLADERALQRFKREIEALVALNHPNIVTAIDSGQTGDRRRYLAMNYIRGMSLDDYLRSRRITEIGGPDGPLRLFVRICMAVHAAHERGIMHRDLKPNNIRIDDTGEPHILDFGLARGAAEEASSRSLDHLSITGDFLGSLPWSSPEQALADPSQIDVRTDVYSLGVILYQILTGGRFPYEVEGPMRGVLNNILKATPIPLDHIAAEKGYTEEQRRRRESLARAVPAGPAIEAVVMRALAKKPGDRFANAGALGLAVERALAGGPDLAGAKRKPDVVPGLGRPRLGRGTPARWSWGLAVACSSAGALAGATLWAAAPWLSGPEITTHDDVRVSPAATKPAATSPGTSPAADWPATAPARYPGPALDQPQTHPATP